MRLTSRLFVLALCGGEAIPTAPPSYYNLNNKLAPTSAFEEGVPFGLSQNYTEHLGQSIPRRAMAKWTSLPPAILPLPVTSNRGSSTAIGTAWSSTFVVNIRSFHKRLETAAKLSVALCIAVRTAVGNRLRVDSVALRRLVIDGVVALGGAFQIAVRNRFRMDSVELRRRIIDGVVVAFSVSIVSSIASYYVLNKIQGQAVTVVVDLEVVKKLLQDDGFKSRSCKSIETARELTGSTTTA